MDVAGFRVALAGFERVAAEQRTVPVEHRLTAVAADGSVIVDVVQASIDLLQTLITEAEADAEHTV